MVNDERLVLGIETSCDETAAAVYSSHRGVVSNELFSQIDFHKKYGGVVPEIASRSHIEKISGIVDAALQSAAVELDDIDCIAVTNKPGLPGSLLVGLCFAKGLALSKNIPLIGVNHLEGHAYSSFLEGNDIPFPHLCITASGGHTALYIIRGFGDYVTIGQTLDDAAGEAFDKVAKMLDLGYPGGPIVERFAKNQNFHDFFKYTRSNASGIDFSFSGLKTAVLYDLVKRGLYSLSEKKLSAAITQEEKEMVCSSLLVCIRDVFLQKLKIALAMHSDVKALTFVGGVACNSYLKQALNDFSRERNLAFFSPRPRFCTDNAAMIAFVGNYKADQGLFSGYDLDILI